MKLEQLKSVIKEEVQRAINERRIVRNEVRRAISEALPKLGSGKRFKNLTKKLAAKEAVASIKNKKEAVVPKAKREAVVAQPAALSPTARLMPKPNKPPKAVKETEQPKVVKESFKSLVSRIVREEIEEAKVRNPKALAAWIGRKKLGKKKFQDLAAAGRRKH